MECKRKLVIYYQSQAGTEKEQVRLQHIIGRELLKYALDREYQMDFTEEMICYARNGKPMLKNAEGSRPVHFNISHCRGMVVCALSDCPIGIDVESSRNVTIPMIRKICNEQEEQYIAGNDNKDSFLELWTLKESYLKMTGEGIRIPLHQVNFYFTEIDENNHKEPENEIWRTPQEIRSNREGYYYQTKLEEQYILAVCSKEPCNRIQLREVLGRIFL